MCIPEQATGILILTMGVVGAEMYQALLLAQVPEDVAKAAAAEVAKSQDVASKSDVLESGAHLRAEMDERFAELRAEMDKRFAEVEKVARGPEVLRFSRGDRSSLRFLSSLCSFHRERSRIG